MVFERRPPSPSIQTSARSIIRQTWSEIAENKRTFGLDLATLGEGKIGSEEIVVVKVGD